LGRSDRVKSWCKVRRLFGQGKEDKQTMTERQIPCPRCRKENPPGNRFCGSCGAPMRSGEQLATPEEHRPVPAGRTWSAKLSPVSKALAMGVAALATEAGLSWIRHKIRAEDRSSRPAIGGPDSAPRHYLVGQSLEKVLVQTWDDSRNRAFRRRELRSFVATIVRHHGADHRG